MSKPRTTRLRFVTATKPELIQKFCDTLGVRIQIYGSPSVTKDGKRYILWFVPSDEGSDIKSINL